MNINKINSIGFSGKTEMLYAIEQAAKHTKSAAYKADNTTEKMVERASAKAYLDMLTKDIEFVPYVVKSFNQVQLKSARDYLRSAGDKNITKHVQNFREIMQLIMEENGTNKIGSKVNSAKILLDKLV